MKLNLVPEADLTRPEMENIKLRLHRVETKEISTVTLGAIANSLLTTRGDIIVRNATVPERLALTVPASPTINFLGVANGETQPTWKSASSAGAADAHVVATDESGYTRIIRLGVGIAASYPIHAAATITDNSGNKYGQLVSIEFSPTGTNSDRNAGQRIEASIPVANSYNFTALTGLQNVATARGTGNVTTIDAANQNVDWQSTGTVATATGTSNRIRNTNASGTITDARLFCAVSPTATGAITTISGLYVDALKVSGVGTAYSIWLDGPSDIARIDHTVLLNNTAAPSASPADATQLYSADLAAGDAGLHIRSETGAIHKFGSYASVPGLIVNDAGDSSAAADMRVESDTEANMLWLDASADVLYLGGSTNGLKVAKGGIVSLIGSAIRSPTSSGTGAAGEICWDANYIYICTAANTWKRVALTGGY